MKLDAHIHDPTCAACHARSIRLGSRLKITTPSAAGAPRRSPTAPVRIRRSILPANSPTAANYSDADEFKKLLLADIDAFNHTFVEKLATYGLRRSMSFSDRDELKAIAAAGKAKDYRLRDIVEAFVLSDLFQKR